jgi:transcriptional regulator with GAF, ATPase, and Fis domain
MSKDPRFQTTEVADDLSSRPSLRRDAELRIVHPTALVATVPLGRPRVILGRQPDDDVVALLHATVSRKHFAVEWDATAARHLGADQGSRNGSKVDGQPAGAPTPLGPGSVIRVGSVLLVYDRRVDESSSAGAVSHEALPGQSAAIRELRAAVGLAAVDPSPALIIGETGTGKELVASELHRLSGRSGKLVAVNCAALTPQLVESQLFGHIKGAFTGAHDDQPGLFRAADHGTLFLDEIGELPLDLQPKLLRALQEREVRPVGGTRNIRVDVRVVAATNRDLAAQVQSGHFRRDLYARLSLWEIRVPALRERRADLLGWIERLHRRWNAERGRSGAPALELDANAAEAVLLADWPDNLRGLDRLVHALGAAQGDAPQPVALAQLPEWVGRKAEAPIEAEAAESAPQASPRLPAPTREELLAAFEQHGGSVRAVARHYGRDRRQIYRWMEAFGIKEK